MQTTATLATEFDTTPRTLRKFLRSNESGIESVGKGSRYSLPTSKREVNALKKKFDNWTAALEEKKSKPVIENETDEVIDEVIENEFDNDFDSLECPLDN